MRITESNRRWWVLVAMTGSNSMILLDQTVVSVALTTIQQELALSETEMHWAVNAYVLAVACMIAFGGRLGDVLGKPRVFIIGVGVFVLSSLACGLTPGTPGLSAAWMIAFRAIQGLGAALMLPASSAIAVNAFPLEERGRAMAIYSGIGQSFLAIGPVLGGVLTQYTSWRWVFLLNVPIGALAVLLTVLSHPPEAKREREPVDLGGAALLILGIGLFVWGLQQGVVWTWTSALTWGVVSAGVLSLVAFVVVERRVRAPLVDFRLFKIRAFKANNLIMFALQAGLTGTVIFGAIYFQTALVLDPISAGLALLPLIMGLVFVSRFAGAILDRYGARLPVTAGLALAFTGMLLWTLALPTLQFVWQAPGMMLLGFGLGLIVIPIMTDSLNRVPAGVRGQASGVLQTTRQMGGSVGIAVIGTLFLISESPVTEVSGSSSLSQAHLDRLVDGFRHSDPSAIAELQDYPALLATLKQGAAEATQAGFWFPVVTLGIAWIIALLLMEKGKQDEEAAGLSERDGFS